MGMAIGMLLCVVRDADAGSGNTPTLTIFLFGLCFKTVNCGQRSLEWPRSNPPCKGRGATAAKGVGAMHIDRMIEAKFHTGPVTLNYAEGPDAGPPLVLLHGGSARWQYFDDILPDLTARWHVFAPDLRGHGLSGRTAGRYTLRDYADDLAAFLQKLSGPASLFGHSLGGMVALMTASKSP